MNRISRTRHRAALAALAVALASAGAWAQAPAQSSEPKIADCDAFEKTDYNKTIDVDPRDIDQCILRGGDPPVKWRPSEGKKVVTAPGAGTTSVSGRMSPPMSPGARGMAASVSGNMFDATLKIPPWRGFPCQLPGGVDMCGGGKDGTGGGDGTGTGTGGNSSCPVATDTTGTFGQQQTITTSISQPLACGGAVPLSTYLMGAEDSPVSVIATEAGNRTAWVYRASGSGFALQGTLQLPTNTCVNGDKDRPEPLALPIAQIVTINGSTPSVALRLQTENGGVHDPFDPDPEVKPPQYFVVPTPGGNPQISAGCPSTSQFVRDAVALTAPLTVESAINPGCEGGPQVCGNLPANPTSPSNCDALTTNPAGASCANTTLFAVLNRPNLLFPPNSTAVFASMEGRTAHLVGSTGGARLYAQADTLMYFGARGGSFVLPEGGTMKLANGTLLFMNGPATINAGGRQVVLSAGGQIVNNNADTLQEFAPGSSYSPNAQLPYVVKIGRSVELPPGMKLPTQPSPFVRLPVKVE